MNIFNFPDTWIEPLGKGFCQDFLDEIDLKFSKLNDGNVNIFPPINSVFRALELVHFKEAKILILGQDPYHGLGQANGLSFSVNKKIGSNGSRSQRFSRMHPASTHARFSNRSV